MRQVLELEQGTVIFGLDRIGGFFLQVHGNNDFFANATQFHPIHPSKYVNQMSPENLKEILEDGGFNYEEVMSQVSEVENPYDTYGVNCDNAVVPIKTLGEWIKGFNSSEIMYINSSHFMFRS